MSLQAFRKTFTLGSSYFVAAVAGGVTWLFTKDTNVGALAAVMGFFFGVLSHQIGRHADALEELNTRIEAIHDEVRDVKRSID